MRPSQTHSIIWQFAYILSNYVCRVMVMGAISGFVYDLYITVSTVIVAEKNRIALASQQNCNPERISNFIVNMLPLELT